MKTQRVALGATVLALVAASLGACGGGGGDAGPVTRTPVAMSGIHGT